MVAGVSFRGRGGKRPPERNADARCTPDGVQDALEPRRLSRSQRARSPSAPQPVLEGPILPIFGLPFGALGESALPLLGFGLLAQHAPTPFHRSF